MPYFNICSHCGARLDPGEVCDCQKNQIEQHPNCATNSENISNLREETIAAVNSLTHEERKELLALLTSIHGDEVSHILHRDGWE